MYERAIQAEYTPSIIANCQVFYFSDLKLQFFFFFFFSSGQTYAVFFQHHYLEHKAGTSTSMEIAALTTNLSPLAHISACIEKNKTFYILENKCFVEWTSKGTSFLCHLLSTC